MTAKPCGQCGGCGWICEEHPDQPWRDHLEETGCHGATMPCPICHNSTGPNDPPDVSRLGLKPVVKRD